MPGLLRATPALPLKSRVHGAEQALALLTQPLTKDLPERHIASLKHLCAELKHGCTLDSLPTVSKVLGVVIDNVRAEPAGPFVEVAYELLRQVLLLSDAHGSRRHHRNQRLELRI